jgi:hypothetical protein
VLGYLIASVVIWLLRKYDDIEGGGTVIIAGDPLANRGADATLDQHRDPDVRPAYQD